MMSPRNDVASAAIFSDRLNITRYASNGLYRKLLRQRCEVWLLGILWLSSHWASLVAVIATACAVIRPYLSV